jgi:hypothetical protein
MGLGAAALVYGAVTLLLFHNLLPGLTTHLYPDLGDPLLNAAVLAWNAKRVPLTAEWWNFPSFAPLPGMTSLTEHLLLVSPVTTPIIWITNNPVLAYNVVLLLALPLNGVAAWLLARELTQSNEAAFVAGLAYAFAPYQAVRLAHLQTLLQFGMPLALLGLHRYAHTGGHRPLAIFAAGWAMAIWANVYTLAFFPILVALWCVWFIRPREWKRLVAIGAVAVAAALPIVPLLLGYQRWHSVHGLARGAGEARLWAADVASLIGISDREVLWHGWLPTVYDEASFFPGLTIGILAVVGVAAMTRPVAARPHRWPRWLAGIALLAVAVCVARSLAGPYAWQIGLMPLPDFRPFRLFTLAVIVFVAALFGSARFREAWRSRNVWMFYATAAVTLWLFALGPEPEWMDARILAYGPYRLLLSSPIVDSLRVTSRIWLPVLVCLSVLASGGLAMLIRRHPRARRAMTAAAAVFILAESWFFDTPDRAPVRIEDGVIPHGALVLDVPLDSFDWNTRAQYRAVMGDYRSVNGYSGYALPGFSALSRDINDRRDEALNELRRGSPLYVLVASEQDPTLAPWIARQSGAERLNRSGEFELYRLPELR